MLIIHWIGRAVNKNRRYRIAKVKDKMRLVKTDAYKNWITDIGWAIKARTFKRYKNLISVMISATLDPTADHHNLVSVILDALQFSGLVVNDRDVGAVMSLPCGRHKRGMNDEIWVFVQEGKEEKADD